MCCHFFPRPLRGGLTDHARYRSRQRRIAPETITLVRKYGWKTAERGAIHLSIDSVARPLSVPPSQWSAGRGVVVVEGPDRSVITVFRRGGR